MPGCASGLIRRTAPCGSDRRGELAKRFMIDSVMKLKDGSWFFKRMKVEVRDPSNPRRTVSVSYIDMDSPE